MLKTCNITRIRAYVRLYRDIIGNDCHLLSACKKAFRVQNGDHIGGIPVSKVIRGVVQESRKDRETD